VSLLAEQTVIFWPLGLYTACAVALVIAMLAISYVLGERSRRPPTMGPYESGMVPTGSARLKFPVNFYLVAIFFVVFDLEAVFIFAWAVRARQLGWSGYIEMLVFVVLLLVALVYLWRIGALDWGTRRRMREGAGTKEG
jgi:NADH-quinone oxidoreductase subunit A